ncbi:MAG: lysylphosphatidylglycerol synthase domain-containing protein [Adhaeribacter sp.]
MMFSFPRLNKFGLLFIKALIGLGTFYFLFKAVFKEGLEVEAWLPRLWMAFGQGAAGPILLALALMAANWGLEAGKWQLLSRKVERLTFWQAYRSVLVGMCLGFITPNRLGDYAGRIIRLKTRRRLEALGAVFLGRFCQLLLTLTGGSLGWIYFSSRVPGWPFPGSSALLIGVLAAVNIGGYVLLFHPRILLRGVAATPFLNRFMLYLSVMSRYGRRDLWQLLALSAARYLVFLGQFLLLLQAFNLQADLGAMAMGVASTFLLKSILPSLNAFTDLGTRELSAMYFFSMLGQDKALVMSASLSLWLLNLALPSLFGLLLVWQIKLKSLRKSKTRKPALQEREILMLGVQEGKL